METKALPCPFCGRQPDIEDGDTLYPNGGAWRQDSVHRSYHSFRNLPVEQWCYDMICNDSAGGCSAQVSGDGKSDALAKWNRRAAFRAPPFSTEAGAEVNPCLPNAEGNAGLTAQEK